MNSSISRTLRFTNVCM